MNGRTDDLGRAWGPRATSGTEGCGLGLRDMGLVALQLLLLTP